MLTCRENIVRNLNEIGHIVIIQNIMLYVYLLMLGVKCDLDMLCDSPRGVER